MTDGVLVSYYCYWGHIHPVCLVWQFGMFFSTTWWFMPFGGWTIWVVPRVCLFYQSISHNWSLWLDWPLARPNLYAFLGIVNAVMLCLYNVIWGVMSYFSLIKLSIQTYWLPHIWKRPFSYEFTAVRWINTTFCLNGVHFILKWLHMSTMAFQIPGTWTFCSTACSG